MRTVFYKNVVRPTMIYGMLSVKRRGRKENTKDGETRMSRLMCSVRNKYVGNILGITFLVI